MKKAEIIATFIEQLIELRRLIVEANEDKHLRIGELIQLIKQSSKVLKAIKQLQGVHLYDLTDAEIEHLVALVMVNVKREVRFTQKDAVHALCGVVHFMNIGR